MSVPSRGRSTLLRWLLLVWEVRSIAHGMSFNRKPDQVVRNPQLGSALDQAQDLAREGSQHI